MSVMAFAIMLLLLLGPLRKLCMRNARFAVPAMLGAVVGYCLGLLALAAGLPYPWLPWVWAALAAFFVGEAGSEWFRRVFRE